jgi:hypothetical protein
MGVTRVVHLFLNSIGDRPEPGGDYAAFRNGRRAHCSLAVLCHPWERAGDSGGLLERPVPRHQFVDALLRPTVDEACQQVDKIGLRIDAVELTGLDQ